MTTEELQEAIYQWAGRHKRIICYIAGIVGTFCFLLEACDVIH